MEQPAGDDVALDLRAAAVDGGGAGVEELGSPAPAGRVVTQRHVGAQAVSHQVEHGLLGRGHQHLVDGGLGAQRLAKDRIGWGKYRAGLGYEQIATARGSGLWGFMTGCEGSKFPSAQGLFGGYSCPSYQLMKIKGINVFEVLREDPRAVDVFDIVELMNKQPIKGGKYSSNDMGMTFEICNEGEIYMICQGSGGGYGDVLERDPALVMKDLAEDLMSHENARDIYKVVYDEKTLVVDEAATKQLRDEYRQERIRRGKPFDKFCDEWVTPEPPAQWARSPQSCGSTPT